MPAKCNTFSARHTTTHRTSPTQLNSRNEPCSINKKPLLSCCSFDGDPSEDPSICSSPYRMVCPSDNDLHRTSSGDGTPPQSSICRCATIMTRRLLCTEHRHVNVLQSLFLKAAELSSTGRKQAPAVTANDRYCRQSTKHPP